MAKQILFKQEALDKLALGAQKLNDAVTITMGAKGQNVLIEGSFGAGLPHITKDGVTVAKSVELKDVVENTACTLVKNIALMTNSIVGDGPQPLYAKVLTPKGFVAISSLKVGDNVCGTDRTLQKVEGVFRKGSLKVFKVKFSDGREVECSENHLWTVTTNWGLTKTMPLVDIITSGFLDKTPDGNLKAKYYVQNDVANYEHQEVVLHPYLMGVLLGDGSFTESMSDIEISLGVKKEFVIENLLKVLPIGISLKVKFLENKNYFRIK